jgi:hypothetical protein
MHRFHAKFVMDDWSSVDAAVLEEAVTKAESIAEIIELEACRAREWPGPKPFYVTPPSMSDDDVDVAELDAKVRALTTLYRITSNPKVARLRLQAYDFSVANDLATLVDVTKKAQLLREVKSHSAYIKLISDEYGLDLYSPLEDVVKLHSATSGDMRLLKQFTKCPMCKQRHAPSHVLKKHPHLRLKATGTTHLGGKQCCVSCAPYWD